MNRIQRHLHYLICTFLFAVSACTNPANIDLVFSFYSTLSDAHKAGIMGPGKWIPDLFPSGTTHVFEAHDIDTNETWISANVGASSSTDWLAKCRVTKTPDLPNSVKSRQLNWWPNWLVKGGTLSKRIIVFACTEESTGNPNSTDVMPYYVLRLPKESIIFVWRPAS